MNVLHEIYFQIRPKTKVDNPRPPLLDPSKSRKDDIKVYNTLYMIVCLYI